METIIVCKTCEHNNIQLRGVKGFIEQQTEFLSLTDAMEHWKETRDPYSKHELIIKFIAE